MCKRITLWDWMDDCEVEILRYYVDGLNTIKICKKHQITDREEKLLYGVHEQCITIRLTDSDYEELLKLLSS